MKTVILFGAGASAFSGSCNPKPPPLGNKLFEELVSLGEPASILNANYGDIYRENFEQGMQVISKPSAPETLSAFIQAGGDIHDTNNINNPLWPGSQAIPLIRQVGQYLANIELTADNTYCTFINQLKDNLPRLCLATLNYDLLLEQAFSILEINFSRIQVRSASQVKQLAQPCKLP